MEIVIAEKGAFYFDPIVTAEEARGRASAHKVSAFGTLSRLLSRPKRTISRYPIKGCGIFRSGMQRPTSISLTIVENRINFQSRRRMSP